MFFGFGVSPYLTMMRRGYGNMPGATPPLVEEPEEKRPAWRDIFLPKTYGGEEVDRGVAQRARARGLGSLGIALLEGASTNDWGGSLAKGFAAMRETSDSELERERMIRMQKAEEERRAAAEGRAVAQEADRDRQADVDFDRGQTELEVIRDSQARGKAQRERTGKSAEQMVAEINAIAAQNPEDEQLQRMAKRAAGYALGEDSDLNNLAKLHEDMTEREFEDVNAREKAQRVIAEAQEQSKYGFGPIAEGGRAERGLSLEAERGRLYAQQVASSGGGRPGVKPATWYSEVNAAVDDLVDPWLKGRMAKVGEVDSAAMADPKRNPNGPIVYIKPPTQEEIDARRRAAEPIAIANVNRLHSFYEPDSGDNQPPGASSATSEQFHVRNLATDALLQGHSEAEVLATLRSKGNLHGLTPEQYLENAKNLARQKGWRG